MLANYLNPPVRDPFDRNAAGATEAKATQEVELTDGGTFELHAGVVRKQIGDAAVTMFASNGSILGPTLKAPQGAEVAITVKNEPISKRPFIGLASVSTIASMARPPRRRRRSRSAAASPITCGSPMRVSTGTTRTCARTTPRNLACTHSKQVQS